MLFINSAKAQCPTGTAPYVSVNPPSAASSITTTSASISVAWSAWSGGFGVTVYIEYGLNPGGPYTSSITYNQAAWNSATATVTPAGAGTYVPGNGALSTSGTFTANLTSLTSSSTYYYRARIVGSGAAGTCTSTEQNFTTLSAGPFTVTTTTASSITLNTATAGGSVTQLAAVTVVQRGVVWNTSTGPTIANSLTNDGSTAGAYPSSLTGLISGTTYYYRAYVTGSDGITYYGPEQSFTTLSPSTIISPYALPNEWRFGAGSGLSFPTGNFLSAGAPTATPAASNPGVASVEESASLSDRAGALVLYTNTMEIRNITNAVVRNLNPGFDAICAGSATQGAVIIPDPSLPDSLYYVFIANDLTGGICGSTGIHYYKFKKNSGTGQAQYVSGPTLLSGAGPTVVDETICAGNDGQGNYWIGSHSQSSSAFKFWKVTSAGIAAIADQSIGSGGSSGSQGSMKISPCQDRIAYYSGGNVSVYPFNRATAAIGAQIHTWSNGTQGAGLEFSPDANILYTASLGTTVNWYNISANTNGNLSSVGAISWGMQLGPDGKIYTAPGGTTIGIINTPNSPTTTTYGSVTVNGSGTYRGLITIPWLSPKLPKISSNGACPTTVFGYDFKNYYLTNIDTTRVDWDFGTGTFTGRGATPTHTFASNGTYNVVVKVTDKYCNQIWKDSMNIVVPCSLPLEWVEIAAITDGDKVSVNWATAKEENNDYFIIQRSEDGINFTDIGKVKSKGSNSNITRYEFTDRAPLNGQNYYRVVQYDINKDFSISKVVTATLNQLYIAVSPNPSGSGFNAHITGAAEASYSVIDLLGREILTNVIADKPDFAFGSDFAKGIYILRVVSSHKVFIQKLVKE